MSSSTGLYCFERLMLNHRRDITGPPCSLLPEQTAQRRCCKHEAAFHLKAPRLCKDVCMDPDSGLLLSLHCHCSRHPPPETHPACCAPSTFHWITHFLTDMRQQVRPGHITPIPTYTALVPPSGVFSRSCSSLLTITFSCDASVNWLKFADDTTVTGFKSGCDELAYRLEVEQLISWCSQNNIEMNLLDCWGDNGPEEKPLSLVLLFSITPCLLDCFHLIGSTITQNLKTWPT